jgi:hypothetical protein
MPAFDVLATTTIRGIWQELTDQRQVSKDLRWTKGTDGRLGNVLSSTTPRIPTFNCLWGDVAARITDRVTIAPVMGLDQQAPLKVPNTTVRLEQTTMPKIKHGIRLDEEMLRTLARVQANLMTSVNDVADDEGANVFMRYEIGQLEALMDGVEARLEHMAIGMLLGNYTYANEHGVQFNMTYQLPSECSVTPALYWGDGSGLMGISHSNVSATPISDIYDLQVTVQQKYGIMYNRMSISYRGFQYIIGTNEFKALAPLYMSMFHVPPSIAQIPTHDTNVVKAILSDMLHGMEIEIDDRLVMWENNTLSNWNAPPASPAAGQYIRFQPINQAIFTCKAEDGNLKTWDIANVPLIETYPGMIPGLHGTFEGAEKGGLRGPIGYATSASLNGNTPGKELWAAMSAIPRRKNLPASAVITFDTSTTWT